MEKKSLMPLIKGVSGWYKDTSQEIKAQRGNSTNRGIFEQHTVDRVLGDGFEIGD